MGCIQIYSSGDTYRVLYTFISSKVNQILIKYVNPQNISDACIEHKHIG